MYSYDRQRLQQKRYQTILLLRLASWTKSAFSAPWKLIPVFLFFTAAAVSGYFIRRHISVYYTNPILKSVLQYLYIILFFTITAILFVVMLVTLSTPRSAKRCEDALLIIGLTAHDGMPPALIARTRIKRTNVYQFTFYSLGISKDAWMQRQNEIEDALNIHILGTILYGRKSRNWIAFTATYGVDDGKDRILYDEL